VLAAAAAVLEALVDWDGVELDGLELAGVEPEVQPARPTVPAISSAVAAVERFIVVHFVSSHQPMLNDGNVVESGALDANQ
jgi:hypothetical protein